MFEETRKWLSELIFTPIAETTVIENEENQSTNQELDLKGAGRVILWGILGIFSAVVLHLGMEKCETARYYPNLYLFLVGVHYILRDVGIAMLSGGVIARVLEIKNIVDFTRNSVINALTSNSYLKKLSIDQLKKVKDYCNQHIFEKGGNRNEENLNQSILKLESSISEYLFNPYYEDYRLFIVCDEKELSTEPDFAKLTTIPANCTVIKKTIKTRYKLINPHKRSREEQLEVRVNIYCPSYIHDPTLLNKITNFSYIVDNGEKKFETLKYEVDITFKPTSTSTYNVMLSLKKDKKPFSVNFNDELEIEIEEVRYIFVHDHLYTRKMNKPSKRTVVNYTYNSPKVVLKAECFGFGKSNTKVRDMSIDYSGYSVNVESTAWMLPGNGILIVHMPIAEAARPVSTATTGAAATTGTVATDAIGNEKVVAAGTVEKSE